MLLSTDPRATSQPIAASGSLASAALNDLTGFLNAHGSGLTGPAHEAIAALLTTIETGLTEQLEPTFYLSSIDPGIGKTLSVAKFMRAWKANGFRPASSVLIGVSRLAEITAYLEHAGLDETDIAVLTSSDEMNVLGVAEADHATATVMFTSQQMIQSRTRGVAFADAAEFHYQGKPRPLRIWDETIIPAEAVTIAVDDLGPLAPLLRKKHGRFVDALQELQSAVLAAGPGGAVTLPHELADLSPAGLKLTDDQRLLLRRLSRAGGQTMLVIATSREGLKLAGGLPALPDDFAPAIVLDASGRVRSTYKLWKAHRGTLRHLPAAANDYSALAIHLWPHPVGKHQLRLSERRSEVAEAIAEVINRDDRSRWLIVHYKDAVALFDEVRQLVQHDAKRRLDALTWGQHHGTNAFRDVQNVMIVGQLTYAQGAYEAHAIAASGRIAPRDTMGREAEEVRRGEFQHNLLQALCRTSVRRSVDGAADYCRAFMVCSAFEGLKERVADTFPGCRMFDWSPDLKPLTGRVGEAVDRRGKRTPVAG